MAEQNKLINNYKPIVIASMAILIVSVTSSVLMSCGASNKKEMPLKFTATQDDSSVGYSISSGSLPDIHIQYSLDDGVSWVDWTDGSKAIDLNNEKSVCVRNTSNKLSVYPAFFQFIMAGKIKASGDISSMINYSDISENCFYCLFNGCTSLVSAPTLPAITLKNYCYQYMFSNCSSLVTAPALPATTLGISCYQEMFSGCTSLVSACELPGTVMKAYCYNNMFSSCTSLKINDEGIGTKIFTCPDTTAFNNPTYNMFYNTGGSFQENTPVDLHTYYWSID